MILFSLNVWKIKLGQLDSNRGGIKRGIKC